MGRKFLTMHGVTRVAIVLVSPTDMSFAILCAMPLASTTAMSMIAVATTGGVSIFNVLARNLVQVRKLAPSTATTPGHANPPTTAAHMGRRTSAMPSSSHDLMLWLPLDRASASSPATGEA